ncbi:MAG: hypothetical protein A3K19_27890 [Lentisphaerae bacterium RIFOXYB12_FULL_65_16]|nr:MAG: hypothetical protein A3K18_25895 [Lentisphaerae bacterium RIFOXYA12_64_32]OGV88186.1 MAG: hypothetical protein A3K19_27890 [Lentisphaerae bacterium RIFOXYB12_FULL_65_16]
MGKPRGLRTDGRGKPLCRSLLVTWLAGWLGAGLLTVAVAVPSDADVSAASSPASASVAESAGPAPVTVDGQGQSQGASFSEKLAAQVDPKSVKVEAIPGGARLRCELQDLVGTVTPDGLNIESVSDTEGGGAFTLRLTGWGRSDRMLEPAPGQVAVDGNRVTNTRCAQSESVSAPDVSRVSSQARSSAFRRSPCPMATRTPDRVNAELRTQSTGALIEEFTTSGEGIRHDLVVLAPPAGTGELVVTLALTGAEATQSPTGTKVRLPTGRELTYDQLRVTDAAGRVLDAHMTVEFRSLEGEQPREPSAASTFHLPPSTSALLAIRVDDANARYPVRIDPTITDANWRSLGGKSGAFQVCAMVVTGAGDLVVGGYFNAVGDVVANCIARWNGGSWFPLGSGMDNGVTALAVSGLDLYAGGEFTAAGGVSANHVAKWDGSSWSALGSGMGGDSPVVNALAVSGTDLYAAGDFHTAGGVSVNHVAKWDGSSWSALGTGMSNYVNALAVSGSDLYAGGYFGMAGGVSANGIAKWDGSSWSALGSGVDGGVFALAVSGTDLYAGGFFGTAGGIGAHCIAKWDGSSWSALGSSVDDGVFALVVSGTDLYAGGRFTTAGGSSAHYIAKWNGNGWSALGSDLGGDSPGVEALAVLGTDVCAGGLFSTARWDGSDWVALGSGLGGVGSSSVFALAVCGSTLYAGGNFTTAGGVSVNRIAKWDGSSWSAFGSGMNGSVSALAVSGADLYAGGGFTTAGGVNVNHVAKWNGESWSPLGSGMNDSVCALAVSDTDVYAGGNFTTAGGNSARYIAKWDGSSWSALGSGMGGSFPGVIALAVSGTDLYAGGWFTTAGGVSVNRIAKWDGSGWSALGSGTNGGVKALAVSGTDLYAGGVFTTAGGNSAHYIAKWDGSSWSALGSGVEYDVNALAISGTALYAGGYFGTAGGVTANYIAKWDGSNWNALGSGMNSFVHALAVSGMDLYAGGEFTRAGNKVSAYAAWLDSTPPDAPTGLDLATADDTGSSGTDDLTKNTSGLTITGSAEAGSAVRLYEGVTLLATGTAADFASLGLDISLTGDGAHNVTATATDVAGNVSVASSALTITVDTTAPTANVVAVTRSALDVSFDETVTGASVPAGYVLDPAVSVSVVEPLGGAGYRLTTAPLVPGASYALNFPGIADLAGNAVANAPTVRSGTVVTVNLSDSAVARLDLGRWAGASDGFEDGIDTVAPAKTNEAQGYAYLMDHWGLDSAPCNLVADFRAATGVTRSRLVVDVPATRGPVTLSWDVSQVGTDEEVYLQLLDNDAPAGPPTDMKVTSGIVVSADSEFELVWGVPEPFTLVYATGWNLVGSPLLTLGDLRCADGGAALALDPCWFYDGGQLLKLPQGEPLPAERGIWVYSPTGGTSQAVYGLDADGRIQLVQGWNLISPVHPFTLPDSAAFAGPAWWWDPSAGAYVAVLPGSVLQPGHAYWVRVRCPGVSLETGP